MTPQDIDRLSGNSLTLGDAAVAIWNAAEAHAVGSHKDFTQIHAGMYDVLTAIVPRIVPWPKPKVKLPRPLDPDAFGERSYEEGPLLAALRAAGVDFE